MPPKPAPKPAPKTDTKKSTNDKKKGMTGVGNLDDEWLYISKS